MSKRRRELSKPKLKSLTAGKRGDRFGLDDVPLQPWFLPKKTAYAILRLLPTGYRQRMRKFYDDYGCLICGEQSNPYKSNGMCEVCAQTVRLKLKRSANRHFKKSNQGRFAIGLVRRANKARKLLSDISRGCSAPSERNQVNTAQFKNPVLEAYGPPYRRV
jgi:hypothetical protein